MASGIAGARDSNIRMSPYFHAFSCWLHSLEYPPYVVGKKEVFLPIGNKLLKTHCQIIIEYSVQFSSVAQLSQTLCDPWTAACQTSLSITNSWSLPKFMSIESVMPSNHLTSVVPFSSCLQSFPASGSFQVSQLFASSGQSIGASASASVLPMNTQDWSPLGWTGWISLHIVKSFYHAHTNQDLDK